MSSGQALAQRESPRVTSPAIWSPTSFDQPVCRTGHATGETGSATQTCARPPPPPTQAGPMLRATRGQAGHNVTRSQTTPNRLRVVAAIPAHSVRTPPRSPAFALGEAGSHPPRAALLSCRFDWHRYQASTFSLAQGDTGRSTSDCSRSSKVYKASCRPLVCNPIKPAGGQRSAKALLKYFGKNQLECYPRLPCARPAPNLRLQPGAVSRPSKEQPMSRWISAAVVTLVVGIASPVLAKDAHVGTWKENLAKSNPAPTTPAPQSVTWKYEVF
jgi:hypothetical protein